MIFELDWMFCAGMKMIMDDCFLRKTCTFAVGIIRA